MEIKPLVEWSEQLSVGIEEIDEQHKVLTRLINNLYEAIIKKTDLHTVDNILTELVEYTVVHFAVEESLMRIFDYPQYEEHKKHHQELASQVMDIREKVKARKTAVSMELLNFLRSWLTNHIMIEDKHYSPYFLGKGVKSKWSRGGWTGKIWDFVKK